MIVVVVVAAVLVVVVAVVVVVVVAVVVVVVVQDFDRSHEPLLPTAVCVAVHSSGKDWKANTRGRVRQGRQGKAGGGRVRQREARERPYAWLVIFKEIKMSPPKKNERIEKIVKELKV